MRFGRNDGIRVPVEREHERESMGAGVLHREPELIAPGHLAFLTHALIVPSTNPDDLERHDAEVEKIAMDLVPRLRRGGRGGREGRPHARVGPRRRLERQSGLDQLSIRPTGQRRAIEVKGRAGTGDIEVSSNEWARAANLRDGYWIYAVYDCATPTPRLARVQDPFGSLLARPREAF